MFLAFGKNLSQLPTSLFRRWILFATLSLFGNILTHLQAQTVQFVPLDTLYGSGISQPTKVPHANRSANQRTATANIQVQFTGFPAAHQVAFEHAINIWATELFARVPITVEATYTNLPAGVLGTAGANLVYGSPSGAPLSGYFYPAALANQFNGCDLAPGSADIVISISSLVNWYTGTDLNPGAGQYDLVTVVLHELGHGLGVSGTAAYDDGTGTAECTGNAGDGCMGLSAPFNFMVYDHFVINGSGQSLDDPFSFTNPSSALGLEYVSGNLFWNGPTAVAANGGTPPAIYAPNPFQSGSSYSHLDESSFPAGNPNSLMTPTINAAEAIHDPGNIMRGMLIDMGWELSIVPQAAFNVREVAYTNLPLNFSDASASSTAWGWDFDNNGVVDNTGQNPIHTYTTAGNYVVELEINNNPALSTTTIVEVYDQPAIPFTLDFETSGDGMYPNQEGCLGWEWGDGTGKPNYHPGNYVPPVFGSNSWFTNGSGTHGANQIYVLETPPIDFAGANGDYFLKFHFRAAVSPDAGMNMDYSIDGGNTWNLLGSAGADPDALADWYDSGSIAGLDGEAGWAPSLAQAGTVFSPNYRINVVKGYSDVRFRLKFGAENTSLFDGFQVDALEIDGNVLPLSMRNLRVNPVDAGHLLSWDESNPDAENQYDILRSVNGEEFQSIGQINAQASNLEAEQYEFLDALPIEGKNRYQVRKKDLSGQLWFSDIVEIEFLPQESFQLGPNPVSDELQLKLWEAKDTAINFQLFDLTGKMVWTSGRMEDPQGDFSFDLSGLSSGLYVYKLQLAGRNISGKLIRR